MDVREFDIVGVRDNGVVTGYAKRAELSGGTLIDHLVGLDSCPLLEESAPILDALRQLRESSFVLVLALGHVSGIVTKGDLQKAPIRMWLFGVLSLLEMQLLRLVRGHYPDASWQTLISPSRLEAARCIHADRRRRNEHIDLADCLQFADKRTIILKNERVRSALGFPSLSRGEEILKELEQLRDRLAHAQDIITGQWPRLADVAAAAEDLLVRAEEVEF
jgi:hypothetical protein